MEVRESLVQAIGLICATIIFCCLLYLYWRYIFKYHALRRFVGSILADKHKISSKAIQKVLRHKKLSTTEKYLKKIHYGLENVMALLHNNPESSFATNDATSPLSK